MTEEQREQLNKITEELGGKLEFYICADFYSEHKRIIIDYDVKSKRQDS
jgi:hypothetical protein